MKTWGLIVTFWKEIPRIARDHARLLVGFNLFCLMLAGVLFFFDREILTAIRQGPPSEAYHWAGFIGKFGDFAFIPTWLCLVFWLFGTFAKRPGWKVGAVAVLMAASIAGINVNLFRATLGRPRPSAQWEHAVGNPDKPGAWFLFGQPTMPEGANLNDPPTQRLYGPSSSNHFQSTPSGHCATSFAFSTAVCVLAPAYGIPATLGAGAVAWARMERNRHWPADVVLGSALGTSWGLILGIAGRRYLRRQRELAASAGEGTDGDSKAS